MKMKMKSKTMSLCDKLTRRLAEEIQGPVVLYLEDGWWSVMVSCQNGMRTIQDSMALTPEDAIYQALNRRTYRSLENPS